MSFLADFTRPSAIDGQMADGPLEDDFDSVVMTLCLVLGETDAAFRIGGFGEPNWPVDVRYDLSTFVEQLPEALASLSSGSETEIDLYGQGIERTLRFCPEGDVVRITCDSRTLWRPNPEVEVVPQGQLVVMFTLIATEFAESLRMVWPRYLAYPPFKDWSRL
jgi:hypothetical protein